MKDIIGQTIQLGDILIYPGEEGEMVMASVLADNEEEEMLLLLDCFILLEEDVLVGGYEWEELVPIPKARNPLKAIVVTGSLDENHPEILDRIEEMVADSGMLQDE